MQLDTSRGRCPKKVLPIGDTTCCFYTHEVEQIFRPRKSTLLDGRGYDRFLHVSRTYPIKAEEHDTSGNEHGHEEPEEQSTGVKR